MDDKFAGYFVAITRKGSDAYPIHIGWTRSGVSDMLTNLQEGNPHELEIVAVARATPFELLKFHAAAMDHSQILSGSWFTRSKWLMDVLEALSWGPRGVHHGEFHNQSAG